MKPSTASSIANAMSEQNSIYSENHGLRTRKTSPGIHVMMMIRRALLLGKILGYFKGLVNYDNKSIEHYDKWSKTVWHE